MASVSGDSSSKVTDDAETSALARRGIDEHERRGRRWTFGAGVGRDAGARRSAVGTRSGHARATAAALCIHPRCPSRVSARAVVT
mmetsp:Transcript_11741/g.47258  ORF Transcript_11741/g.47258 Transcript_11741/m.47258 type:complete len:85 (-) Transcript_11741:1281-1535(-)